MSEGLCEGILYVHVYVCESLILYVYVRVICVSVVNVALDDLSGGLCGRCCMCVHVCMAVCGGCVMCASVVKASLRPMSEVLCA